MALKSIQLAHMDRHVDKSGESNFRVTIHSDDQQMHATFACSTESDARILRDALREHANSLQRVADYSR